MTIDLEQTPLSVVRWPRVLFFALCLGLVLGLFVWNLKIVQSPSPDRPGTIYPMLGLFFLAAWISGTVILSVFLGGFRRNLDTP